MSEIRQNAQVRRNIFLVLALFSCYTYSKGHGSVYLVRLAVLVSSKIRFDLL